LIEFSRVEQVGLQQFTDIRKFLMDRERFQELFISQLIPKIKNTVVMSHLPVDVETMVYLSNQGGQLIAGDRYGIISAWDLDLAKASVNLKKKWIAHAFLPSVEVSSDGHQIFSLGSTLGNQFDYSDQFIRIWETRSYEEISYVHPLTGIDDAGFTDNNDIFIIGPSGDMEIHSPIPLPTKEWEKGVEEDEADTEAQARLFWVGVFVAVIFILRNIGFINPTVHYRNNETVLMTGHKPKAEDTIEDGDHSFVLGLGLLLSFLAILDPIMQRIERLKGKIRQVLEYERNVMDLLERGSWEDVRTAVNRLWSLLPASMQEEQGPLEPGSSYLDIDLYMDQIFRLTSAHSISLREQLHGLRVLSPILPAVLESPWEIQENAYSSMGRVVEFWTTVGRTVEIEGESTPNLSVFSRFVEKVVVLSGGDQRLFHGSRTDTLPEGFPLREATEQENRLIWWIMVLVAVVVSMVLIGVLIKFVGKGGIARAHPDTPAWGGHESPILFFLPIFKPLRNLVEKSPYPPLLKGELLRVEVWGVLGNVSIILGLVMAVSVMNSIKGVSTVIQQMIEDLKNLQYVTFQGENLPANFIVAIQIIVSEDMEESRVELPLVIEGIRSPTKPAMAYPEKGRIVVNLTAIEDNPDSLGVFESLFKEYFFYHYQSDIHALAYDSSFMAWDTFDTGMWPENQEILELIIELVEKAGITMVLDVATGIGTLPIALAKQLKYLEIIALDKSEPMLAEAWKYAVEEGVKKIHYIFTWRCLFSFSR